MCGTERALHRVAISQHSTSDGNAVSESVDRAVDEHPWLERVTQWGWIAKAVVYTLMGVTAIQIARQSPTSDAASPDGSIRALSDVPFSRAVLAALTFGLLLYALWRALSVAVISGNGASEWANRVGYAFSGIFYLLLAYTAGKAAITGLDPKESSTVEDLSASVMEMTAGRTMVGLAGVATIGVGLYFGIHKGLGRSFVDDLDGVSDSLGSNEPKRRALLISGIVGWVGRGIVTALVGFFVLRAAIRFDPDDARGFDKALRQVAGTTIGSMLVFVCAIGLIAYGLFCFFSHRFRSLEESDG